MGKPKCLPDHLFQSYLEHLILIGKNQTEIFSLTDSSQEKIDSFTQRIKADWEETLTIKKPTETNLAFIEAKLNKLYAIAYDAYFKSTKRKKIVYKNNVKPDGTFVENHKIIPSGQGEVYWLRLILDIIKYQASFRANGNLDTIDSEFEKYLEYIQAYSEKQNYDCEVIPENVISNDQSGSQTTIRNQENH